MAQHLIDADHVWPRDGDHRYRLYLRDGDDLAVAAATPTMCGIGTAIGELDRDCREAGSRLSDEGQVGVLDAVERRWIVLPWGRGPQPRFSDAELRLIAEALDSHEYRQLSDERYRNDGHVLGPGSDDPDRQAEIREARRLIAKVERLAPRREEAAR